MAYVATDLTFVERGDFESVCAPYRRRVWRLCRRLLRSEADADDATQDVMLRAYNAWSRFEASADPWPWLATIATNVCRDTGRRRVRAAAHAASVAAETEPTPDAYDDVVVRLRHDLVHDALDAVPATYRASLYLREIEGWSVADIAAARGRSAPAVRSSLMRGRKILATRIEELAKDRKQWPLPAAVPLVANRVRARLSRMREGIDRLAISGMGQLDLAAAGLASAPLRAVSQLAAVVVMVAAGVAAVVTGDGDAAAASGPVAVHAPPASAAIAVAPTAQAAPDAHPAAPAVAAPGIAPTIAVTEPRLEAEGTTATPGVAASPGTAVPGAEDQGVVTFVVGPFQIDCDESWDTGPVRDTACASIGATVTLRD